jgi:hypothetical protein
MIQAIHQSGAASTFEDFEPLICSLVTRFYRRRWQIFQKIGKDQTDLYGVAVELFLKAYITHDEAIGEFAPRVRFIIWNGMLDRFHADYQAARRRVRLEDSDGQPMDLDCLASAARSSFNVVAFRSTLSGNAREAMKLALYPPQEVQERAEAAGGGGRNYAAAIRSYLIRIYGLSPFEVRQCFTEISDKLKSFDGEKE